MQYSSENLLVGVGRDEILGQQVLVALILLLGAVEQRPVLEQVRLCLLQAGGERTRVDLEQDRALAHFVAFLEAYRDELAVDPGLHRDGRVGLDVADGVQPHGHRLENHRGGRHRHGRSALLRIGARPAVGLKEDEHQRSHDRQDENAREQFPLCRHRSDRPTGHCDQALRRRPPPMRASTGHARCCLPRILSGGRGTGPPGPQTWLQAARNYRPIRGVVGGVTSCNRV